MFESKKYPFAYAVAKDLDVYAVRPTLASALDAARESFSTPAASISIAACFEDGTEQDIPDESLQTADKSAWITADEARQLERTLFPPPTVREQVTSLRLRNADSDYWEKLVLKVAEALLAQVDKHLRGIPLEEVGLEKMDFDDYENLPEGAIELYDGIPSPKRWRLYQEGRHRLGFATMREEFEAAKGEYERRRQELRKRPFVPSQVPFPSGPPEN